MSFRWNNQIFHCPENMNGHSLKVLKGEYDVPGLELEPGSVILDIGANCGAFTLWAYKRWPQCLIHAYEPNPEAAEYFRRNCKDMGGVALHQVAVTSKLGPALLKFGKNNLGEASLYDLGEQQDAGIAVNTLHPKEPPKCDVLKLDCEGSELDILENYCPEPHPKAVMLEFHSPKDRIRIDLMMRRHKYTLQRGHISRPDRGTLVYAR